MLLKVKALKLLAGKPIVILHQETAKFLNLHANERVRINKPGQKQVIIAPIDITSGNTILNKDEVALSQEITSELGLKSRDMVKVNPALRPLSTDYILKKLNKQSLTFTEIYTIVSDIVDNNLTEAEIAYFVSAIYLNGMSTEEIVSLTRAMVKTGKEIKFDRNIVFDKHSIGGLAGNRTTPIVTSIIAAAIDEFALDAVMPKTSSRAITSAAGTADVLETLANVEFTVDEMKKIVDKTNACIVWGGALGLAPADDKIIQIERLLSLDPDAQLLASIISKKLSVNANHVLIDIPYGHGAKVDKNRAEILKKNFEEVARHFNLKLKVVLTNGSQPIGNGLGPVLEMRDVLSVLKQEHSMSKILEHKSIFLATELLSMVDLKKPKEYIEKKIRHILESHKAYNKFQQIIKAQKGSLVNLDEKLKLAKFKMDIKSKHTGHVKSIDSKKMAHIARVLGCPSDARAGIFLHKHLHDKADKGERLYTIYAESREKIEYAKRIIETLNPVIVNN